MPTGGEICYLSFLGVIVGVVVFMLGFAIECGDAEHRMSCEPPKGMSAGGFFGILGIIIAILSVIWGLLGGL